jgi:hypothetical protein
MQQAGLLVHKAGKITGPPAPDTELDHALLAIAVDMKHTQAAGLNKIGETVDLTIATYKLILFKGAMLCGSFNTLQLVVGNRNQGANGLKQEN